MDVTATNPSFAQIKVKSEPGIARIGTTPSAVSTQLITAVQVRANVKYIPTHTCTFYTHTRTHTHTHTEASYFLSACMLRCFGGTVSHIHTLALHAPTHPLTHTHTQTLLAVHSRSTKAAL